jgi:hypothetical protein
LIFLCLFVVCSMKAFVFLLLENLFFWMIFLWSLVDIVCESVCCFDNTSRYNIGYLFYNNCCHEQRSNSVFDIWDLS